MVVASRIAALQFKRRRGSAVHPLLQSHPKWVAHSMLPDAKVLIGEDGALVLSDVVRKRRHQ
jgi:hypothetical protein